MPELSIAVATGLVRYLSIIVGNIPPTSEATASTPIGISINFGASLTFSYCAGSCPKNIDCMALSNVARDSTLQRSATIVTGT